MAALLASGVSAAEAAEAVRSDAPFPIAEPLTADHYLVAELIYHARRYDEPGMARVIGLSIDDLDWAGSLDEVLMPTLRRLGQLWQQGSIVSANEHFAAEVIRRAIDGAMPAPESPENNAGIVMLACPEDERHDIGLFALALLLRKARMKVCYIGCDVPASDLVVAAREVRPDIICLSATMPSSLGALGNAVRLLIASRLGRRLFVGGPAVDRSGAAAGVAGVHLPRRIRDAAAMISESVGTRSVAAMTPRLRGDS
jgi:methanogenic corrinoid protein MtbC1